MFTRRAIYIVIADRLMHCLLSSSLAKITLVVPEITFKVAVITSPVVKIIFVVAEITFKVAVITSSVDKISCLWPRSLLWWRGELLKWL